ncbi:pentapeptide repeat-containing protein [Pectobacterium brasiliense]|uniref:pentapeptide repeat-containing protein n=1 Tax=Pectobacterium TaxID=122277 RepID=UPI0019691433|nr:pentapeptide repeat-containing protein [Pectobacterium brasiliense]QSD34333.1 pentapeptide repeat-containing protein [Pectobacterium brasiliense]
MIKDSGREKLSDKKFDSSVSKENFVNKLFERVVALNVEFKSVNFRYCIFDAAYIRNCSFQDCDFTGCRFLNCNLLGSSFSGCKFDYVNFDKTQIDNDILEIGCPGLENLKLKFSRSLRLNYQQIGDSKSANKAIAIELQATEAHLHKAWKSKESYYRKKYKGIDRVKIFGEWVEFKLLDLIWGNGESSYKLCRAVILILLIIAGIHVILFGDPMLVTSYSEALFLSPQIFLGVLTPSIYPTLYLTVIILVRLIMFGFFMSIIIKRFNRR